MFVLLQNKSAEREISKSEFPTMKHNNVYFTQSQKLQITEVKPCWARLVLGWETATTPKPKWKNSCTIFQQRKINS